ncbi:MAG: secretin N-terminal domain-containing protein [Vicinamibacteria bacterium]
MARPRVLGFPALPLLLAVALLAAGCATSKAFRQGQKAGQQGDWDLAVARLTKALGGDPRNIRYKIALENAKVEAARVHHKEAQKRLAAQELEKASEELVIATRYDPSNLSASEDLRLVQERLRELEDEKRRLSDFESMRDRVRAAHVPLPVLSARSPVPITMKFADTSLQKVFESLSKLTGVNILTDEGFRDKRVDFNVSGITFEEALDQLTLVNRLFYKVLDQNTLIIVPESAQKRRQYEDNLVRTFYLQNTEANDIAALLTKLAGVQKVAANQTLGAITVVASPDRLALVEKIIEANDKARGEVMVEVQILEVNRIKLKSYGIELSNYEASLTYSPTGAAGEVADGFTNVRAHLLSSLSLSDFVVSIPSTIFARFLQTESTVRILASPRLRAAEGKKTELSIGTEVPIPVTTFTSTQAGTSTFAPATSFQYRNVGVTLGLTPKVSANGEISLELGAEFSLLGDDRNVGTGQNPIVVPTFLSRKVTGVLRLKDGETSLIGGLLQGRESDSFKGALGIQSIPILNKIFTSRQKQSDESEVLISITPHLVRAPKLTEKDLKSLYIGSEEIVRVPSARPRLFGLPEPAPETASPGPAAPQTAPSTPASAPEPAPTPAPTPAAPEVAALADTAEPSAPTSQPLPPSVAPPAAAAPTAGLSALIRPGSIELGPGDEAAIDVVVLGARDLTQVELVLAYDPSLLEGVEATAGTLLTLDGVPVSADKRFEAGRARVRLSRQTPATGSGAVCTLRFRALKQGNGLLALQSLLLTSPGGGARVVPAAPARVQVTE